MTVHRLRSLARAWPFAAILAAPAFVLQFATARNALLSIAAMMQRGEPRSFALYIAVYVVAISLGGPFALFNTLAGYAFGFFVGALTALPTATLAATGAFGVGRLLRSTRFAATLRAHPRFAVTELVLRTDGLRIATLLRLSPLMPQNLLTFLMALTPLSAARHALATFIGLLPVTLMQVYLGSVARDLEAALSGRSGESLGDPKRIVPLVAGLVMTGVFVTLAIRRGRSALAKALASAENVNPEAPEQRDDPREG